MNQTSEAVEEKWSHIKGREIYLKTGNCDKLEYTKLLNITN
jgi:hypothetical protein